MDGLAAQFEKEMAENAAALIREKAASVGRVKLEGIPSGSKAIISDSTIVTVATAPPSGV